MMLLPRLLVYFTLATCVALLITRHYLLLPLTQEELRGGAGQLTVRVNTFRRLDLLDFFLDYYKSCDAIKQIQVVWSDQESKPPTEWLSRYPQGKVLFEVHSKDSLNNRFIPLQEVPTEAVLSIDDDLIIPCNLIGDTLRVWNSFPRALVGFSPRMITWDTNSGNFLYLRWQHTWWSGLYSVMLTKIGILHRDYLENFSKAVPQAFQEHVNKIRNCEDIAMAHIVAKQSNAAPVWIDGVVYEVSEKGISSGQSHFHDRSECISLLSNLTGEFPWVTGQQKISRMHWQDLVFLQQQL
jgi:glucuronyl/N-acetylglucosaminyl transferase EXT2